MQESKKSNETIKLMIEEHLKYDIELFLFSTNYLTIDDETRRFEFPINLPRINEGMVNNVCLEHWVISLRKMHEFLFETKKNSEYFFAKDCFEDNNLWFDLIGKCDEKIKRHIMRSNSMTAHLSYSRIKDKSTYEGWSTELSDYIIDKLNKFFNLICKSDSKSKMYGLINYYKIIINNDGFWQLVVINSQKKIQ